MEYILDLRELKETYDCNYNGVLHIGAHGGLEYEDYKLMGLDPIIFVEPQPNIFERLKQNVGEECICLNLALGNMIGEVEMFTNENDEHGASSILEPKKHLYLYPFIEFTNKIKVPITKVDLLDLPKCNLLNIDVQGYELEVLKGATEYLKSVEYILIEVNDEEVYTNCAMVADIDSFLEDYGFSRVETKMAGGCWGDAFYIKKNDKDN